VIQASTAQCLKIQREQKIRRQSNPSHFTKFGKIRRNLGKFDRNAFDERKEQEFLKTRKSAEFAELANNSAE
jgi:hypothetical protein